MILNIINIRELSNNEKYSVEINTDIFSDSDQELVDENVEAQWSCLLLLAM